MTGEPESRQDRIAARVAQVSQVMHLHGGRIELVDVTDEGDVEVRFLGMCQGCPFRPVTMHATIVPALMALPEVTSVRANGTRISDEALERLTAALGDDRVHLPSVGPASQ